ncbi:MAG: hypothetical protein HC945_04445 [Nitrosarchaeum sp.]|nr:hypothetical protein [Nitrosarchaeum sp.]
MRKEFAKIERAVRKFAYAAPSSVLAKYLEDPVLALEQDANLDVVPDLDALSRSLEGMELKDGAKVAKVLGSLSEEFLASWRQELARCKAEHDAAASMLKGNMAYWSLQEQEEFLAGARGLARQQELALEQAQERVENVRPSLVLAKMRKLMEVHDARLVAQGYAGFGGPVYEGSPSGSDDAGEEGLSGERSGQDGR